MILQPRSQGLSSSRPLGCARMEREREREKGRFLLYGKTGCSTDKSNGTYFPPEIFRKEKGIPSEVFLFSRFHQIDRKILFYLRRFNSSMLPGELNARVNSPGKHGIRVIVFTCPNKDCSFQSLNTDDFIGHNCTTAGENSY